MKKIVAIICCCIMWFSCIPVQAAGTSYNIPDMEPAQITDDIEEKYEVQDLEDGQDDFVNTSEENKSEVSDNSKITDETDEKKAYILKKHL